MTQANLSEILFKPRFKHPETSTLVKRAHHPTAQPLQSALDGQAGPRWYRMINRLMWIWRGIDALEMRQVLARIAASDAERTDERLLDTVVGYRNGNWIYEWSHQAMLWQQRALESQDPAERGKLWLMAANYYNIAAYPHLKGDELAEQAEVLANRAYQEAAHHLPYQLKELEFAIPGGAPITGFLHQPAQGQAPFPTVLICGGLDMLQSDHYRLFSDYLAPRGIAMLTIDMPSIGFSSRWKLTQDTSFLHQQVLAQLDKVPWVDHTRVSLFGFRFGANVAVRLGYLESRRLRAVACLGPLVHELMSNRACQEAAPDMYMDVLASRMGMSNASDAALRIEMGRYSLKTQGLLGRHCPTPMLSGYWAHETFSPKEESRLIASSSRSGKLLEIGRKPVYRSFDRALNEVCDWLQGKMCE
ncbi:esterase FrsA [Nissabacter sp. SGAir0207]|uniref:esterase FrsA n=1 Tax=Nissabacter sp. SGAir0207 TaxID=2126321 RepID=UPI0010CD36D2|nr:esterase FrsA [Nissabacter sp. SGAir0207]QCR36976.1 esterase FrsA [Nissabacter sp. SGAir0207]